MRGFIVAVALLTFAASARAQIPIVGVWEGTVTNGQTGQDYPTFCHNIYTADGFYSRTCVPTGRPKLNKKEPTPEDRSDLSENVVAQFGTYSVSGNTITLKPLASMNPDIEGTLMKVSWRIDGETLIFTMIPPTAGGGRYHRVKPNTPTQTTR